MRIKEYEEVSDKLHCRQSKVISARREGWGGYVVLLVSSYGNSKN
jgi:hypothetical protein